MLSIESNPFYRFEAGPRRPQTWRDARGWLLGRGVMPLLWRLFPLVAVAGGVGLARLTLPDPRLESLGHLAFWLLPLVITGLVVLVGAVLSTGRDWQQGRMEEWKITPADRALVVSGKAWGWALPMGAALAAGGIPAAVAWAVGRYAGWGVPLFAPLEGVLLLVECWAALLLMAHVGIWAGNAVRRAWPALWLALLAGVPLLAAVVVGLFYTLDLARLGGHLMVIGGAWLAGAFFQGWSERMLR